MQTALERLINREAAAKTNSTRSRLWGVLAGIAPHCPKWLSESDQVFGARIESLRPYFTITLKAIWRFWATSIVLRDIADPLWMP